jgi:anti-sigma factor RsiW
VAIDCKVVWREISLYIEGEIDPALRAAVETHITQCPGCSAVLNGTRNIIRLARDPRVFHSPAGFSERLRNDLLSRLSKQSSKTQVVHTMSVQTWWASALAACLAAALWSGASMRDRSVPSPRSEHSQPAVRVIPTMVAIDEKGKIFHVPTCPYLRGKHKLVGVENAIQNGYAPCVRCEEGFLAA